MSITTRLPGAIPAAEPLRPAHAHAEAFPANRWCAECGCGAYRRPGAASVYLRPDTGRRLSACPDCGERLRVRATPFPECSEARLKDAAYQLIAVEQIEIGEGQHEHFGRVETHRATGLRLLTRSVSVDVTGYDRATLPDYVFLTVDGLDVALSFRSCRRAGRDWFAVYGVEASR